MIEVSVIFMKYNVVAISLCGYYTYGTCNEAYGMEQLNFNFYLLLNN
jgi:hypothetical protein